MKNAKRFYNMADLRIDIFRYIIMINQQKATAGVYDGHR